MNQEIKAKIEKEYPSKWTLHFQDAGDESCYYRDDAQHNHQEFDMAGNLTYDDGLNED
jgi:hypothetical protein